MSSPDWVAIKRELVQWVARRLGIDETDVAWRREPAGFKSPVWAELDVVGYRALGTDGTRSTYDPTAATGQEMTQELAGQRVFTLSVRVFCQENEVGTDAWARVTGLVDDMRSEDSLQEIRRAGLALRNAETPVDLTRIHGNRERSAAMVDIGVSVGLSKATTPRTYIEYAPVEHSLTDPDGNVVKQDTITHQVG